MRKLIPLKFLSLVLLVVMLTVAINGVLESAHAMQSQVTSSDEKDGLHSEIAAPHQCPCTPLEQHKDYDGCDTCVNCACHAPLTIQPFQLSYNPSILDNMYASDPFKHLPEVYLSKFIPPQNQA
jgi:hypothetical protein